MQKSTAMRQREGIDEVRSSWGREDIIPSIGPIVVIHYNGKRSPPLPRIPSRLTGRWSNQQLNQMGN